MHVVATAGHVDHGKSTLVHALTGMAPDRLEEERRRGLSIELGYCWTTLDGAGEVAFVDVPGHERFVTTTLAGLGPVPAVLFVVAADDPWMPQAAEHLAALDALEVRHGVLAVTRADLADPGVAMTEARHHLARTGLCDIPGVVVSGRTGAGLDDLRGALADQLAALDDPDAHAPVRLWLDRSFHVRGSGTVVTGTLPAGTISVGDTLASATEPVRVRGVESLGRRESSARGVARVALDLGGGVTVRRGEALTTPGAFVDSDLVDVRLRGDGDPPDRPVLHVGATSVTVHARPLADGLVRLRLDRPLPWHLGDRALLRDPGDRRVWGVQVLDPSPPTLERRGAAALRAKELQSADGSVRSEVHRRGVVRRTMLHRLGAHGETPSDSWEAGDWVVSAERVEVWRSAIAQRLSATNSVLPLSQLQRELGVPDPRLVSALLPDGARVSGAAVLPQTIGPALASAVEALRADLAERPFVAPDAERLRDLGLDPPGLALLVRAGLLTRIGDGIVLLPGAEQAAVERLADLPAPFTASEARQALDTSRRVALPLLAHLDRTGRTLRLPDDRRRLRRPDPPVSK